MRRLLVPVTAGTLAAGGAVAEERVTARDIIDAIAGGEMTAAAAVQAALDAAEAWSVLNGMATPDAERALAAAETAAGPLAGLPIVVKDNVMVAGLPNAAGTPALAGVIAPAHAPVVQALVDAGAIVIGTSNMHELAFGISGWNPTYQTGPEPGVRNPYDTSKFAGGSSSGTGALVGAGVVAAGIGTDTGGSVRIPAAVNGVSGLRPTIGRYPAAGVVPISSTRDTPGVIAASVADIELLDRVITGADPVEAADLSGVTLGVGPGFTGGLGPDVAAVWANVRGTLERVGVTIVEVDDAAIFELNNAVSFPIALTEANADLVAYLAEHAPGVTIADVAAGALSPDVKGTYEALVIPGMLPGPDGLVAGAPIYAAAMAEGRPALIAEYARVFDESGIDALIFPTTPVVAVDAGPESSSIEIFGTFIRNTDPGSNAGIPGLSLAGGLGPESGLPVGIELDGPAGSDRDLIAIGMAIERVLGLTPVPEAP